MNDTRPPTVTDELQAAYAATLYRVEGECPRVLRVKDAADYHDAWLRDLACRRATVITAWNPFSQPLSAAENDAANRSLAQEIDRAGIRRLPAVGEEPGGGWHEDGYCVLDADDAWLDGQLLRFGQNAVLDVQMGRGCHLRWHPEAG